jgi:3',5'-cyclic AMP phosphodiesterase CpdA
MSLRFAHFSDIHLTAKALRLRKRDWFTKRASGFLNARLGRGKHFLNASTIAGEMAADIRSRNYDQVIFSGDATTLGLKIEFDEVKRVLNPDEDWPPTLAVPGNHDYYTRGAVRGGDFERTFAAWQKGDRIDQHVYPFVQKAGPIYLIAVNSAQANLFVWDSRGRVGRAQLDRLAKLVKHLPPGPRIMVTHYPLVLAGGEQERLWRRLRDASRLRALAQEAGVKLWLHGHRHGGYFRNSDPSLPFPIVCAGSATQMGRWSYNEYTFVDGQMHGRRRVWSPEKIAFIDGDEFSIPFALE